MPPNPTNWHLRNANRKVGCLDYAVNWQPERRHTLPARVIEITRAGIAKRTGEKAMKDNVNAVHVNLGAYQTNMGDLYIHRLNHLGGMNKMEHYRIFPKNIARVLEIQRLFLAQLEKKAGKA